MFDWIPGFIYAIVEVICWFMGKLYSCFAIVAGMESVTYTSADGEVSHPTLLSLVFQNSTLQNAYWGMALLGIALCFFFTILAVIRKIFDTNDQVKTSLGGILTQAFKSILMILSMSLIMNLVITFSTGLATEIQKAVFAGTKSYTQETPKTFTPEEYAAMARVLDTIGNYSLNPSYNSRYNINSCYNEIRGDLNLLMKMGTFDVQYVTPDSTTNAAHYWQESLQRIINSAPSLKADVPIDIYNESLSNAILETMNQLATNDNFKPLEVYYVNTGSYGTADNVNLDRIVLLMGTFDAARNEEYNGNNGSLTDPVRAPYYYGQEGYDVFSPSDMSKSFDLWNYGFFTACFLGIVLMFNMTGIILNGIARIFNMALLYVAAPPLIAVSPLDDGGKFKQWMSAFVVQCFGLFGTILAMDIMVIFVPIIMDNGLTMSNLGFFNYFFRIVIVWAGYEAVKKANSLISGILSGNGGMASMDAGNISQSAGKLTHAIGMATGLSAAKWAAGQTWNNVKGRIAQHLPFAKKPQGEVNNPVKTPSGGRDGGSSGSGGGNKNTTNNDPQKTNNGDSDNGQEDTNSNTATNNPQKIDNGDSDNGQEDTNSNTATNNPQKIDNGDSVGGPGSSIPKPPPFPIPTPPPLMGGVRGSKIPKPPPFPKPGNGNKKGGGPKTNGPQGQKVVGGQTESKNSNPVNKTENSGNVGGKTNTTGSTGSIPTPPQLQSGNTNTTGSTGNEEGTTTTNNTGVSGPEVQKVAGGETESKDSNPVNKTDNSQNVGGNTNTTGSSGSGGPESSGPQARKVNASTVTNDSGPVTRPRNNTMTSRTTERAKTPPPQKLQNDKKE